MLADCEVRGVRFDSSFPNESSQLPFFRLPGSPAGSKKHVLYDGGQFLPWAMAITASTRSLDQQFGPVNRQ